MSRLAGDTARGIVIRDGHVLLMERWRPGLHYFSIPGGHIEPGETAVETVVRELIEETTITVTVGAEVLQMTDRDTIHHIFLCKYLAGEPVMPADAPELMGDPENKFKPGWVKIADLPVTPFEYWQPLKQALIDGLANNFADGLVIVSKPETS